MMIHLKQAVAIVAIVSLLLAPLSAVHAKLDCGPAAAGSDLARTAAIAANPAGTGAHALASGLAATASKA
ncbi:MAG: hypothetical protein FJ143_15020, partial [Deltaproteobacteria bacterium]|nr:hypothetical protein [Deltaproteobacteria bacterium]